MIAAYIGINKNTIIMKKLFFLAIFACFTYFATDAQTKAQPGNSAYGHSHKKAKKAKKHYTTSDGRSYHIINGRRHYVVSRHQDAQRRAINVRHKTAIRTIKDNDALSNEQQKVAVKQANVAHKTEMKAANPGKKSGKNK